jgi:hypothetical protein
MTLAGGGQPARRAHDVFFDVELTCLQGTDEIAPAGLVVLDEACLPETNFPLKNLD